MIKSFVLSLSIAAVGASYAADWQHNHPQFDPTGKVTLGTLAGVTSQLSNANQQGLQSSASPTILMMNFNDGVTSFDFEHAIKVTSGSIREVYLLTNSGFHKVINEQLFDLKYSYDALPAKREHHINQVTVRHQFIGMYDVSNPAVICEYEPEYAGDFFDINISGCQFNLKSSSVESIINFKINSSTNYSWFSHAGQGQSTSVFGVEFDGFDGVVRGWSAYNSVAIHQTSTYENTKSWMMLGMSFFIFEGVDLYLIQFPGNVLSGPFGHVFTTPSPFRGVNIVSRGYSLSTPFFIGGGTEIHYLNNIKPILPPPRFMRPPAVFGIGIEEAIA